MQFQPVVKSVEMIGVEETRAMSIALTGKVFYTFISGLYSRKVESICREMISNARDGHAKRGNLDRPYKVHAPTRWEPWFSVRDFGCSIDHETVIERCSVIGWSSKEGNNTEIGTFGYGMKSPFAKVSQFTIKCWLDGEARTYSYHINEEGIPQVVLRDRRESDEEQGVEVRFDVKSEDIWAFEQAIRWVALPFDPCFECNLPGVHSANITRDDGDFFFTPDVTTGPMVAIGPVWYKIDFSQLPDLGKVSEVLTRANSMVIRTNIGELAVVPSREALEYTPSTVTNLTRIVKAAYDKIEGEIAATVSQFASVWEAASKWHSFGGPLLSHMASLYDTPWGRFGTLRDFNFGQALDGYVYDLSVMTTSVLKKKQLRFSRGEDTVVYVFDAQRPPANFWRRRILADQKARPSVNAVMVELPCPKQAVAAMLATFEKNNVPRAERKIKMKGLFDRITAIRAQALKAIADFGCPTVVYQDELPDPIKLTYDRETADIAVYDPKSYGRWSAITIPDVDDNKLNLVFELEDREFKTGIVEREIRALVKKHCDLEIGHMIGVSRSNMKKFLKAFPEWTDYREVFSAAFFDLEALKERYVTMTNLRKDGEHHYAQEASRIGAALDGRVVKLPYLVSTFLTVAERSRQEKIECDKRYVELAKAGLLPDEIAKVFKIMTGKPIDYEHTAQTPVEDSYDLMVKTFPKLSDGFRDPNEVAIYVLGLEALRAQQAVAFLDETMAA